MAGPLSPERFAEIDSIVLSPDRFAEIDQIVGEAPNLGRNPLTPSGAVPGSPGTNPETPPWAVPFAGQPPTSGRQAAARLAGAAGTTATGGMAGPLGAAARIGVGAGPGAIGSGTQGALTGGLLSAVLEGGAPALGALLRILPGLRNLLPTRPAVTDTTRNWSHSPWAGTSQTIPGPTPSPILNPAGQPFRTLPAPPPPPPTGPVNMVERSLTQPARPYMPNLPPLFRALLGYSANTQDWSGPGQ